MFNKNSKSSQPNPQNPTNFSGEPPRHDAGQGSAQYQAPKPEKEKSWFARHKFLTALLAVVGIGVAAAALGGGGGDGADNAATSETTQSTENDSESADDGAEASEASPAEEEAEAPDSGIAVGTAADVGDLSFTVASVEANITSSPGTLIDEPSGQYVLLKVTVANNGDKAETVSGSDAKLIDDQGREHELSNQTMWMENGLFFEEINPGNSIEGELLYDIPADAVPTTLNVTSGIFSSPVTFALN